MHLKRVIKLLSYVVLALAVVLLIPAIIAFINHETLAISAFVKSSVCSLLVSGITLIFLRDEKKTHLSKRDSFLFTTSAWILVALFGALPFVFSHTIEHYSSAFFEVMSGITTTGATQIDNVEICPKSILLWRAMTNWLGGMGIVVLFVALLPAFDTSAGSFNLIGAETVGPVKGKLTPKTKNTAIILWTIYVGITVLEIILLSFANLSLFDSITIAFSTVSTAGFSVRNSSIGSYNSAYVEVIVTIFMFLAATNFELYYRAFSGKIKEIKKNTEFKAFLSIVAFASIVGALMLTISHTYANFFTSLRYMAFHVISVISTTGFNTTNILLWPSFCIFLVIAMMFIGGCSGSTGGGIKVTRIVTAVKASVISLKKKIHPNGVYSLTMNNQLLEDETTFSIITFIAIYFVTWIIGFVVISLSGCSIVDCLSSTILTLGNIGLGFGEKAFSSYPLWTNWVFSFLMLIGRLELFTVYVLFSKAFWKR